MARLTMSLPGMVSCDADHQAVAADFGDEVESFREAAELGGEIIADAANLRQQFVENFEELERHAGASALPPKVEPCMPGRMDLAARSLAVMKPSGMPQAMGFAAVMISGMTGGSINW